jgi:hypothetical protein
VGLSVRELDNVWIPLADGTRLAARIWLPEDAEERPVPALLEYIPYRKNEWTAIRDATRHPYFAGRGYASVRVDLRGSGESDGLLLDEYGSCWTNTSRRSRTTASRSSPGSPTSPGAAAQSACSASRGAASRRSRSRPAGRPR